MGIYLPANTAFSYMITKKENTSLQDDVTYIENPVVRNGDKMELKKTRKFSLSTENPTISITNVRLRNRMSITEGSPIETGKYTGVNAAGQNHKLYARYGSGSLPVPSIELPLALFQPKFNGIQDGTKIEWTPTSETINIQSLFGTTIAFTTKRYMIYTKDKWYSWHRGIRLGEGNSPINVDITSKLQTTVTSMLPEGQGLDLSLMPISINEFSQGNGIINDNVISNMYNKPSEQLLVQNVADPSVISPNSITFSANAIASRKGFDRYNFDDKGLPKPPPHAIGYKTSVVIEGDGGETDGWTKQFEVNPTYYATQSLYTILRVQVMSQFMAPNYEDAEEAAIYI